MSHEFSPELKRDPTIEIARKFRSLSPTNITREEIREQFGNYSTEDILETVDDSNCANSNPSALFLILDMFDPNSRSKVWTAEILTNPQLEAFDPKVREEAQAFLDEDKEKALQTTTTSL